MFKKYVAYVGITDDEIHECISEQRKYLENYTDTIELHDGTIISTGSKLTSDEIEIKLNNYFNKLKMQQQYYLTHGEFEIHEVEVFEDESGNINNDIKYCENWLPGFKYWIDDEQNI